VLERRGQLRLHGQQAAVRRLGQHGEQGYAA
jgi:hypothetical protein